jgi:hypothetical protein
MRMKSLAVCAVALMGMSVGAHATVIRLSGVGTPFQDDDVIAQVAPTYGSSGNVTVNWNPLSNADQAIHYYSSTYSGPTGAAGYCGTSAVASANCAVDLTATLGGMMVTLTSFFLGAVPDPVPNPPPTRTVAYSVVDLATNAVIATNPTAQISVTTGNTIAVNASSARGFRILFGPDGYDAGINDITYSQTTPVPEPASLALIGAGLVGMGLARRRRG